MNKVRELISKLLAFIQKLRPAAASDGSSVVKPKPDRFTLVSWVVTWAIVLAALGFAFWKTQVNAAGSGTVPVPTAGPGENQPNVTLPTQTSGGGNGSGIERELQLKTNIPERPRYEAVNYRVSVGDAMFSIAKEFNIKPETILYSNGDVLDDNPHNLRPGMELLIPPVDGLYYTWKDGDTVESVATEFESDLNADKQINDEDVQLLEAAILSFPGNDLDLTDPQIEPGTVVMIPGGQRELVDWTKFIPTIGRNNNGTTGTSDFGSNACGGGPVGSGFVWPTQGPHTISGNGYGPGHLGIDITGNVGDPVLASSSGVVTMAQGGYNYGYGNVVQIDHGNGYVTVYAHLDTIGVSVCSSVFAGQFIGTVGNTGNSFGSHLHFEVREGGANINPLYVVQ
ncbi:MAG TPA: LysM peptidoglycan-binding domain-containing M23 family metallopeptidase [Anaerolineales bacterium]|jgi:murein DD-endopeptidase MepM/ murein hydrolase activator NlpD